MTSISNQDLNARLEGVLRASVWLGQEQTDVKIDPNLQKKCRDVTMASAFGHWTRNSSSEPNERSACIEVENCGRVYWFYLSWVGPFFRAVRYNGGMLDDPVVAGWTDLWGQELESVDGLKSLVRIIKELGFVELPPSICSMPVREVCPELDADETVFQALFCE